MQNHKEYPENTHAPNWVYHSTLMHSYDLYPHDYSVTDINMASLEDTIQQSVLKVAQTVEQQLDAELERLDKLDSDDLEKLREQRLKEMKKQAWQQQEWQAMVRCSLQHYAVHTSSIPYLM